MTTSRGGSPSSRSGGLRSHRRAPVAYSPGDSILLVIVAAAVAVAAGRRALGWAHSHGALVEGVLIGAAVLAAFGRRRDDMAPPWPAGQGRRPPLHGWASRRDLRALLVPRPTGDRLVLGALNRRRLVAAEPLQSVLVVGPTQSGKTSGLAIPAILEWAGPVVATSVKADLGASHALCPGAAGPGPPLRPDGVEWPRRGPREDRLVAAGLFDLLAGRPSHCGGPLLGGAGGGRDGGRRLLVLLGRETARATSVRGLVRRRLHGRRGEVDR